MGEKIYRVNMETLSVASEDVPQEWRHAGRKGVDLNHCSSGGEAHLPSSGQAQQARICSRSAHGDIRHELRQAFGRDKSPLTGTIKESNAGGTAAQYLARLLIKALIIEGVPEKDTWYALHVNKDGVTIQEDTEFVGKWNYEVMKTVPQKCGDNVAILSIGPAGEMRLAAANISVRDPDGNIRSLGRGGLGAVMGSKKIKYITIDPEGGPGVYIADPVKFKEASVPFAKGVMKHPVAGEALKLYGTNVLVNILNTVGGLPTKNFRYGQFADHEKISGETMRATILERKGHPHHACHKGCAIQCSQVYVDKDGNYVTSGFEYETIWGFGANCCISDLDIIAECDHILDDVGVDTIEMAVAMGVAMEAGVLPFGDYGRRSPTAEGNRRGYSRWDAFSVPAPKSLARRSA